MDFKLDYSRFSRCFGESLVQKTVETMNISGYTAAKFLQRALQSGIAGSSGKKGSVV